MDNNLYLVICLSIIALTFVSGTTYILIKFQPIKETIVKLAKLSPEIIEVVGEIVTKNNANDPRTKIFDTLKKIAQSSVSAVEQIASNQDIHGQEKKKLALDYFNSISKDIGIDLSELDEKTAEVLIENAVEIMNKEKKSNILLG